MKPVIIIGIAIVIVILVGVYMLGWFKEAPKTGTTEEETVPKVQDVYAGKDEESGEPLRPRDVCQILCLEKLDGGMDLSNGPCLSNELAPDWVCDVVHSPRKEVDRKEENQCSEYGKSASHFVEVDTECNFIREV